MIIRTMPACYGSGVFFPSLLPEFDFKSFCVKALIHPFKSSKVTRGKTSFLAAQKELHSFFSLALLFATLMLLVPPNQKVR